MSNGYNIFAKVTLISVLISQQTDRGQIPESTPAHVKCLQSICISVENKKGTNGTPSFYLSCPFNPLSKLLVSFQIFSLRFLTTSFLPLHHYCSCQIFLKI